MSSPRSIPRPARKLTSSTLLSSFVLGHILALPVVAQQMGERLAEPVAYSAEVPAGDRLLLTVTGTVEVAEKNFLGQVKALQLVAGIGNFRIASDAKGRELTDQVGRRVTLTGERAKDRHGNLVLAVRDYAPDRS